MTRKDYRLIADALRTAPLRPDSPREDWSQRTADYLTCAVADALAADNPRFDRTRFLAAAYSRIDEDDK
jgi:hypothetical protein